MNSMLDVIGSFVIGAILMLAIMNAIFSIHASSMDMQQQMVLTEISEDITTILTEYLSRVGAGVPKSQAIRLNTGVHQFNFKGRNEGSPGGIGEYSIVQGDSVANRGFPLEVSIDGKLVMGPFWLSKKMILTYFDKSDHEITMTNDLVNSGSYDQIRSVRVQLTFFYDAFLPKSNTASLDESSNVKNEVVFWKYFLNMSL